MIELALRLDYVSWVEGMRDVAVTDQEARHRDHGNIDKRSFSF